jgi:hypothetical protein
MLGYDLDFCPASYWDPADPVSAILVNITGENRRQMVRDFITGQTPEELGEIDAGLLADLVDNDTRRRLGSLHPSWMGGEYLPGYLPGEVEIARIVLQSTTQDVVSIRARRRRGGTRILYRVVDEYEGDLVYSWNIKSSGRPLTFRALLRLIDSIRIEGDIGQGETFADISRDANMQGGADPKDLQGFVKVRSEFYPHVTAWYDAQAAAWLAAIQAERWGDEDNDAEE